MVQQVNGPVAVDTFGEFPDEAVVADADAGPVFGQHAHVHRGLLPARTHHREPAEHVVHHRDFHEALLVFALLFVIKYYAYLDKCCVNKIVTEIYNEFLLLNTQKLRADDKWPIIYEP